MPKRTYRPNYSPPIGPRAQEIKALRRELSDLRHDLIRLQPRASADLLFSYYGCTTRAWEKWKRDTAGAVIQHAKVDPALASYPGIEERAACPLCGNGTTAFGARGGFAYPGRLERQLRVTAICTNARCSARHSSSRPITCTKRCSPVTAPKGARAEATGVGTDGAARGAGSSGLSIPERVARPRAMRSKDR